MKWTEAEERLNELAEGRYRSMGFKKTTSMYADVQTECYVYVHDFGGFTAPTWDVALTMLADKMGKGPLEETPEGDDGQ